jgi:hypothetical protein
MTVAFTRQPRRASPNREGSRRAGRVLPPADVACGEVERPKRVAIDTLHDD